MAKKSIPVLVTVPRKRISKTKIAGWLMVMAAVISVAIDALNGGAFDFNTHIADIQMALNGVGFVFLRNAITKVERALF